jgi:predicted ATPase
MEVVVGLAGRVRELKAATQLVSGESQHTALLVIGEAGVGKSRLVAAAAASVPPGVLVVSGWCLPFSESVPFLPIADVLRALDDVDGGRLVTAALDHCPPFVRGEILRLMPGRQERTGESILAGSEEGWRKQRLLEALHRFLGAVAELQRAAIVIEDAHWADTATLELLDYLLTPGHAIGVPVVLTCRSEEAITPTLTEWLARLQRNPAVRRLDLPPLTESETAEQIEVLLGERPSRSLVADRYARSEGNPFFTEQLIAAGQDRLLPPGLTALLLSRTAQVVGAGRDVLAALAVASRPLDEPALARLCDQLELDVREALRDLITRQLLRRPDGSGRYQLRHALLAEAISSDLLASERTELHSRIAELMAGWNDPGLAAEIAEHLAAAGRPQEELRWRVLAGRHADTMYASTEAAQHWQRAVVLTAGASSTLVVAGMSVAELYGAAEDALFRPAATRMRLSLSPRKR